METHGRQYEEADPHHAEGEKKSVMMKVKDKAKKIKNTIKKHTQGQDHDNEPEPEYDEDDDDTEMVDEPQVHDAPKYDSTVIPSTNLPKQVDMNLEKPTDPKEDRYDPKVKNETYPKVRHEGISGPVGLVETQTHKPEMKDNTKLEKPDIEYPKSHITPMEGLEEDPHASIARPEQVPLSNYESKVDDPTLQGGKEARVDPLISQLQDLDVNDSELESNPKAEDTGTHDQFAPQPTPTKDELTNSPKRIDTANPDQTMPQDTVTGKLSAATSAITERAVSAKNVVASKLGYGGAQSQPETVPVAPKKPVTETASQPETVPVAPKKPVTETATGYAQVIAEKLTPVYEKVTGAGTAVVSTVTGGKGSEGKVGEKGTVTGSKGSEGKVGEKGSDKGVFVKEYWTEKLRPGEEDRALSEAITEALHKKEAGSENPVMGKVKESEEVREHLGTGKENHREGEDALAAGSEGVGNGQGMADKLKGAVSSWFGKSAGAQTAQDSIGQSYVSGTSTGSGPNAGVGQGLEDAVHGSNR